MENLNLPTVPTTSTSTTKFEIIETRSYFGPKKIRNPYYDDCGEKVIFDSKEEAAEFVHNYLNHNE